MTIIWWAMTVLWRPMTLMAPHMIGHELTPLISIHMESYGIICIHSDSYHNQLCYGTDAGGGVPARLEDDYECILDLRYADAALHMPHGTGGPTRRHQGAKW